MTIKLTGNFLATARCLIFKDGTGITWTFNSNTNEITATATSAAAATSLLGGVAGSLPYQSAVNTTAMLAAGTTGQLLTITAGVPAWEAVPTWNQNTSGTAAGLSSTLAIGSGGTGQTTAAAAYNALSPMTTKGDIEYESAAGVASRLAIGSTGNILSVVAGVPAWTAAPTIPTAAAPTAKVGLTAVTGAAVTFMASDSAPALDVTITPTWTGAHIFSPASGVAVTVNGVASSYAEQITGNNSSTHSFGLKISAGTTSADVALAINNQSNTLSFVQIGGNGSGFMGPNIGVTGFSWTTLGATTFYQAIGVNGNSPPAQSTGWGTPSGVVVANYNGAAATLLQTSDALGQLLAVLKAIGILGT